MSANRRHRHGRNDRFTSTPAVCSAQIAVIHRRSGARVNSASKTPLGDRAEIISGKSLLVAKL